MKRVCIVQARTNSARLPGKVLLDLAGRPMLAQILRRLHRCLSVDEIVVATTTTPRDDPIAELCGAEGVRVFRGSEMDVLGRMLTAAQEAQADIVVRVTADCPLIDPWVVDRVIDEVAANPKTTDYASNVLRRTFPRGLDVEALYLDSLRRVARLATTPAEREHVTITIRSVRPDLFLTRSVESDQDASDLRWTVDERRDLELIRMLYERFDSDDGIAPYQVVVDHVRKHPELMSINDGVGTWDP